jgi:ABC-type branched-subunit amino acid transport system substrate-binding protein
MSRVLKSLVVCGLQLACGCQGLLGLSDYRVLDAAVSTSPSAADAAAAVAAPAPIAVSTACPVVSGAETDPRSLRIGAMFELSGPGAAAAAMQLRSAELAVAQLNAAGGIALRAETEARTLTLVACDAAAGIHDAVSKLAELDVKAIIGPSRTDSYRALADDPALPQDALLLGLTGLSDADKGAHRASLTLGMTLSEAERGPLLAAQLRALQTFHARPIRAALVLQGPGMTSVRKSQALIEAAGIPVVAYEYTNVPRVVANVLAAPPDVILSDVTADIAAELVTALEGAAVRPDYVLTEAAQGPQLLALTEQVPSLQPRLSLIAATSSAAALPVYTAFVQAYSERYADNPRAVSGVAASYAAVYALAFGFTAAEQPQHYGESLAEGLRQLSGGDLPLRTLPADISKASDALRARRGVTVTSPLGELGWDEQGGLQRARLAVYCVGRVDGRWSFVSSGHVYEAAAGAPSGAAVRCEDLTDRVTSTAADDDAGVAPSGPADAGIPSEPEPAAPTNPQPTDIGLTVQYYPLDTDPRDNVVSPALKIVNRAGMPVPLCSLTLRYYFENEHAARCPRDCVLDSFYSGLQPSGRMIEARRAYHMPEPMQSQAYIEITFPCSPQRLAMGESIELLQQFHIEPYLDFDETNDYSFRAGPTTFADWDRVTLHQDGTLVWGLPPG